MMSLGKKLILSGGLLASLAVATPALAHECDSPVQAPVVYPQPPVVYENARYYPDPSYYRDPYGYRDPYAEWRRREAWERHRRWEWRHRWQRW